MSTIQSSPEFQSYIQSLSPPRELICPITQDLFTDPVVALGDGYTYERTAIESWFQTQMGHGSEEDGIHPHSHHHHHHHQHPSAILVRSPVTNAYMESQIPVQSSPLREDPRPDTTPTTTTTTTTTRRRGVGSSEDSVVVEPPKDLPLFLSGTTLLENKVIASMVHSFRQKLGLELCRRCQRVSHAKIQKERNESVVEEEEEEGEDNDEEARRERNFKSKDLSMDIIIGNEYEQIQYLIDAGADLAVKGCEHGNTAFMMLVQVGLFELIPYMLHQNPPVLLRNDQGQSVMDIIQDILSSLQVLHMKSKEDNYNPTSNINNNNHHDGILTSASLVSSFLLERFHRKNQERMNPMNSISIGDSSLNRNRQIHPNYEIMMEKYQQLKIEIQRRMDLEQEQDQMENRRKLQANVQHRERQEILASTARSNQTLANQRDFQSQNELLQNGLGQLQNNGWGYFPSLAAMQFHHFIPPPSPSFAEYENKERKKLERIVKILAILLFLYLLFL